MPVKFVPTSKIEASLGIEPNGPVHAFFTSTCHKHMDKYVPYDTGTLAETSYTTKNQIIYNQEYAEYVYNGVSKSGKKLNYQTDKHPFAGPFWDKQMASAEMVDVIKETQNYARRFNK